MATLPFLTYFLCHLYLFKGLIMDLDDNNRPIVSGVVTLFVIQVIIGWYIYTSIQESKEQDEIEDFYNLKKN